MKSVQFLRWSFLVLGIVMLTYSLSFATPLTNDTKHPAKQGKQDLIDLQQELNKTLYKPIHVTSVHNKRSINTKTSRQLWSSVAGSGYKARPIGKGIKLVIDTK